MPYRIESASGRPVGWPYKRIKGMIYNTWIDAQRAVLRAYWSSPWTPLMRVVCVGIGKEG